MVAAMQLHCLAGAGAPPEMVRDLRALDQLRPEARADFWRVLGPALNETLPGDMNQRIAAFSRQHDVVPESLAVLVRAYRVLLRSAFLVTAEPAQLARDLETIAADPQQADRLQEAIVPGYPAALSLLRAEATGGAVGDHGAVLLGVDWRLDRLVASTRGDADDAFVGMITLRYREGGEELRLTVQAVPETVAQLRAACDQMMAAAQKAVQKAAQKGPTRGA